MREHEDDNSESPITDLADVVRVTRPVRAPRYRGRPGAVRDGGPSGAIASLVLGCLAVVLCWMPFGWILAAPVAVTGLVLGFFALLVAPQRGGLGYAIAGMATSGLAIALVVAVVGLIAWLFSILGLTTSDVASAIVPEPLRDQPAKLKIIDLDLQLVQATPSHWVFSWAMAANNESRTRGDFAVWIELKDGAGSIVQEELVEIDLDGRPRQTFTGQVFVLPDTGRKITGATASIERWP